MTVKRLMLTCLRCGHTWLRRSLTKLPDRCAKCNSPYWDKPRKEPECTTNA